MMSARVFVWAEGLASNLGDSVLRRGLLRRLEVHDAVHAYVGPGGEGYLSGLEISDRTTAYTSEWRWHLAIVRSCLRRRTVVLMSPGEAIADRRSLLMRAAFVAEGLLARLRGGALHQTGVGIRRPVGNWPVGIRATAHICDIVTWRDEWSRAFIGRGAVFPDWAIGEGPRVATEDAARDLLALSFRGDRLQPSVEEITMLRELSDELGLRPVVVAQVAADDAPGRALAQQLQCDFVEWGSGDHADIEARVRSVYARTQLILSDRVHGLIIAATEGAIPIPFGFVSAEKARRTLDAAGLDAPSLDPADLRSGRASQVLAKIADERPDILGAVGDASSRLDDLAAQIERTVRTRPITVLHSMAGPDGEVTRYADHMAAVETRDLNVLFFSWRRALLGRYDIFHVHWPEYLARASHGTRGWVKRAAVRLLVLRLRLKRTPVVWTMHNLDPHEAASRGERSRMRALLNRVSVGISLNPAQPSAVQVPTVYIPHGHYKERFARHLQSEMETGRIVFFGLIRPYKNVSRLIEVFAEGARPGEFLSVVGRPQEEWLRTEIVEAAAGIEQIGLDLRFVADEELVAEVTRAQLVVLPYLEMNNSGALFVALSLGRPVLVPRSAVNEAIAAEVGSEWMWLFDGEMTADLLRRGIEWSQTPRTERTPAMAQRDWDAIGARHRDLYRSLADRKFRV